MYGEGRLLCLRGIKVGSTAKDDFVVYLGEGGVSGEGQLC